MIFQMNACFRQKRGRRFGDTGEENGAGRCDIYGCDLVEVEALFEGQDVTLFDGPPQRDELGPGDIGVNIDLFRQVRDHYKKVQLDMACRVLADICTDIQDDGYIGRQDDSATRVGTHVTTVQRWRSRFAEAGFLHRHNYNGRFSVDTNVAMRLDADGKVIKPTGAKPPKFRF
ncbi:MAG: hypothetical protein JJ911_19325 [Rhizobiaceae bacterium]|nr:hypothetical protein [Rhizobiaceae bacterium]